MATGWMRRAAEHAVPLERRLLVATGAVALCLVLVTVGRWMMLGEAQEDWKGIRARADADLARTIDARLTAAVEAVRAATRGADTSRGASAVIGTGEVDPHVAAIEIRDASDLLLRYRGRPVTLDSALVARMRAGVLSDTIVVVEHPPFTDLVALAPLRDASGRMRGHIRAAMPLRISLPIENRFVEARGVVDQLARELGADLRLEESPGTHATDGRYLTVPIFAARGGRTSPANRADTVAVIATLRSTPAQWMQRTELLFARIGALLVLVLLALVGVVAWRWLRRVPGTVPGTLSAGAGIVLVRVILYAGDIPAALLPDELRNPAHYASSFAWGWASSPAELTLSVLALVAIAFLVDHARRVQNAASIAEVPTAPSSDPTRVWNRMRHAGAVGLVLAVACLLPSLLRGHAAVLRSFVADSSFAWDDIASLGRQPMLLVMLANAYLVTLAAALLLRAAVASARRLGARMRWIAVAATQASTLAFLFVTGELLLPSWTYVAAALLWLSLVRPACWWDDRWRRRVRVALPEALLLYAACSLVAGALLFHWADEKRRGEIEAIALELAQPVDTWSRALVEQSLVTMTLGPGADAIARVPAGGGDFQTAFTLWAGSPLGSQPNNAAVLLVDARGAVRSRFAAGIALDAIDLAALLRTDSTGGMHVQALPSADARAAAPTLYAGVAEALAPLRLRVVVIVEGMDRTARRRSGVDLLRTEREVPSRAPEDRFVVRVFDGDVQVAASEPDASRRARLPREVAAALTAGGDTYWGTDPEGTGAATFYRRGESARSAIAISIGPADPLFTVYRWTRYLVVFGVTALVVMLLRVRVRTLRERLRAMRFATRLQAAFIAIACLPLVLVWVAARSYVGSVEEQGLVTRLGDDLDVLVRTIEQRRGGGALIPTDAECRSIALAGGNEITVYRGMELAASSRPELYATGLLAARMPAEAWQALAREGRDRVIVRETVGAFSYLVGYRAVRDAAGALEATVATPTLFSTPRAEEDSIRASAMITLGVVLLLMIVLPASIGVARQISRPLAALTRATRDVAAGDLDRTVTVRGAREFGELTDSFNSMTAQLRASREQLAAAERDLAWKEMARQVAHEIRNPLTPMKLAAQHLQRAARDRAPQLDALIERITTTIIDQIDTLARISDAFSRFGRMPRREASAVPVAAVIDDAAALYRHQPDLVLTVDVARDLPPVVADREELARALTNILRNAVQAMPAGGRITIGAARDGERVRITVADTGTGIAPELVPRIFEPNFSTRTEGMGLGLAIVRRIVEDAGGRVHITSEPGHGTLVTIDLCISSEASAS